MQEIPADMVAVVTNGMLVLTALALVVASDKSIVSAMTSDHAPYMIAAGICLSVGIIAYYRALAGGPVSIVVPVFGPFWSATPLSGSPFWTRH